MSLLVEFCHDVDKLNFGCFGFLVVVFFVLFFSFYRLFSLQNKLCIIVNYAL